MNRNETWTNEAGKKVTVTVEVVNEAGRFEIAVAAEVDGVMVGDSLCRVTHPRAVAVIGCVGLDAARYASIVAMVNEADTTDERMVAQDRADQEAEAKAEAEMKRTEAGRDDMRRYMAVD